MPWHFFGGHYPVSPALHPGFSDLWRPPAALSSTRHWPFFECLGIQFFNSSHVTYGTPCRARGHSHSLREADDFPRGGNHSKHMLPPIYLAWLQPMCYNSNLLFIHINIGKAFTCGENFDKKYRAAATLINNHNSEIIAPSTNTRRDCFLHKMSFGNIGNNNKFSEYVFL